MSELALAVFASETGTHLVRRRAASAGEPSSGVSTSATCLERLAAAGYRFLPRSSPDFPPLLRAIHDPPAGLFLRGVAKPEAAGAAGGRDRRSARMLGLRRVGRAAASAGSSPAAGLVVVSGLARGIDAEAHRGALEANGRDGRRPRLRHRPRLSRRARRARAPRRRRAASSSRSTRPASSRRRGDSRPATGSWPGSARRPSSSRRASAAAPSSRRISRSRRDERCSPCPARSRARCRPGRTRCSSSARRR